MKKSFKLVSAVALVGLVGYATTSCGGGEEGNRTVRVGLHSNFGSSAGFAAIESGYFEEYNVDVQGEVSTGPNIAAALIAGTMDVGFLGNGVAWNYFTSDSAIKLLTIDNLTDDDRLIADPQGKGASLTLTSSTADLVAALKNADVCFDSTATPAAFWSSLIGKLNGTLADGQKLWWEDGTGTKLPSGLAESNYVEANEVYVTDIQNTNVSGAMQNHEYDFCVTFAPTATVLESNGFVTVAKTSTHMADTYTPSTWAVNAKFAEENPDLMVDFMKGLLKGMDKRHTNPDAVIDDTVSYLAGAVLKESLSHDIAYWPSAQDLYNWAQTNGDQWTYFEQIRASQVAGANGDKVVKTVQQAQAFEYLLEAYPNM